MKTRSHLYGVITAILFSTISLAADDVINQSSIQSVLKNSSFLTHQINERMRNASSSTDPSAAQYQTGFQDGYNRAIIELASAKMLIDLPAKSIASSTKSSRSRSGKTSGKSFKMANQWVIESYSDLQSSNWEAAMKAATVAVALDPWMIESYINRSWALAESGLLDRAVEDASIAIKIDSQNALAFNNRGYAKELSGEMVGAKQDYQKSCDLSFEQACKTLDAIAKLEAQSLPENIGVLLAKSYSSFLAKDWWAVEQITSKVLTMDPENAVAYVNRSGARSKLGRLTNALADSSKAIRLKPELGIAYNNKGYAHELLGETGRASENYQRACKLGIQQSCTDYERMASAAKASQK